MKKSVSPVLLGAAAICYLWPALSVGVEVSKVPVGTDTSAAKVAGNATAAVASGEQEAKSALKGTDTGTKDVATSGNTAGTKGQQEKQDATTAKTPGTEELPDRIAKKVDDFSVEVVDPDLRRNIVGSGTGMQVLHAESHYATEIPAEETADNDKTLAQAPKQEAAPIIPLERSRKKVVTGAQQELQAGISAFGFVAQEQTRKAVQAEALAREVNEQGRAEAKAREQAEIAKQQAAAKALEPLSVSPSDSDAATAPESTKEAVVATKEEKSLPSENTAKTTEVAELAKDEKADGKTVRKATETSDEKVIAQQTNQGNTSKTGLEAKAVLGNNETKTEAKPDTDTSIAESAKAQAADALIAKNAKSDSQTENAKGNQASEESKSSETPKAASITVAELERLFPMPEAPKPNNTKESTGNVDLRANAGVYHVKSGIGTYRIGVELFKSNQGYSQDQLLTAIYRRNPDKFGARGPLYPYDDVDLVIPTVEQIKLERDGVYSQYLAKNGVRLSVSQLPPRGSARDDAYVADLKKYQAQCKKIEGKRQEYLASKGLKLAKAESSLKK